MDLDYDDKLIKDKDIFGIESLKPPPPGAQAGVGPPEPPTTIESLLTWKNALAIAIEVYGQTNSSGAQMFYEWASECLLSGVPKEDKEVYATLQSERSYWGPRASFKRRMGSENWRDIEHRSQAVICACCAYKSVSATIRGGVAAQWVERVIYRATLAEGDARGEGYGHGRGRHGSFGNLRPE